MKPIWVSTFLLHSETDEHKTAIKLAQRKLHEAVTSHKRTYCSYSGGKDSSVLLYLALLEDPKMTTLHIDFGRWLMPRAIFAEICNNAKKQGTSLRIETSQQWEKSGRKLPKGGVFGKVLFGRIEPQLISEGYDCCLLGLRAEESRKRKYRTEVDWDRDHSRIDTAYPISHLSWKDVWACIVSNKIPYLSHYDELEAIGIGYDKSRISSFFVAGHGMQAVDKMMYPRDLHQYL